MDALLQIIVPNIAQIEGLQRHETYELDGVSYPIEPRMLHWRDVSLNIDNKMTYIESLLPKDYVRDDWVWLKVSDENLDKYADFVNNAACEETESTLETFLHNLLENTNKWVVMFLLHYDQIDRIYEADINQCITELRETLHRDKRSEGFIVYK
ncbi:MAG: hypothetical protein ACKVRN_06105 [Pyrinomonadaceae bacterium]